MDRTPTGARGKTAGSRAILAPVGIALPWMASVVAGLLAQAVAPTGTTFTLRVSVVADGEGKAIARPEWLAAELDAAQALFAPFGVRFAKTDGALLDARLAHVETRADRDAFGARVAPHVVDVFVVDSLRDVDDASQMRRGVHWHAPSGAHYLLLVATAPTSVLAHELGHYFGNPHSHVADNVMSYERTGAPVFFDAEQGRRIAAKARAYVQSGELLPVRP
ncbi:MAG: hypothetical protein ABSE49_04785 [Polyangiaceae bacterium]|jgi:hypothetical protein